MDAAKTSPFPPPPAARAGRPGRALRWGLGALGLLAILAVGHALMLRWMSNRLEEGFAAWAAARRAQGWVVEHGSPERGGWPFEARLRLPNFRLAGGGATVPGGVEWQAGALLLRVLPPRLDELRLDARGPQRLRLGESEIGFAADRLGGRLPLRTDVLPGGGVLEAERLRIGPAGSAHGIWDATGGFELHRLRIALDTRTTATEGEPAVSLSAEASDLRLPVSTPLGNRIDSASVEAALTGPLPPGRRPAVRAETWRDAGGVLELRDWHLRWGEVQAGGAATLALDEALQPMGAGTLRVVGAQRALDAMAEAGAIPAAGAAAAGRILSMLSRPGPDGGPPQIEVPLTLEERALTVARIPVIRLPALFWPASEAPR